MIGPGKYELECTQAMISARAQGCILMIIGGDRGHGFSAHFREDFLKQGKEPLGHLAAALRQVADQLEADEKEAR